MSRYSRQIVYPHIAEAGQARICASHITIFGVGATGSVIAEELARAGVGTLRLVDRDFVEISNLQRQLMYTEEDARAQTPKAVSAAAHIHEINSEVNCEIKVTNVCAANVEELIQGTDLVLDGTDNFELRALINEACVKHNVPWIYGGALGSMGATLGIYHDGGPCFRCISPIIPAPGSYPSCATAGVLGMTTAIVGALEAVEAIKYIVGAPELRHEYLSIDIWHGAFDSIKILRDETCPVCGRHIFEFLENVSDDDDIVSLCTPGSYQITPASIATSAAMDGAAIDLADYANRLQAIGTVMYNPYLLRFDGDGVSFNLFSDGRAVIRDALNEAEARRIYSEYIGL